MMWGEGACVYRKAALSGLIAVPGVAAIVLWLVSFAVPSLLSRDELSPLYQVVLFATLISLPTAVVWRWRVGRSWHAIGCLLLSIVGQGFNCCGFFYCIGLAVRSLA
jgi:hypothetical protein